MALTGVGGFNSHPGRVDQEPTDKEVMLVAWRYAVVINQRLIDDPRIVGKSRFPRDAKWWNRYLPLWTIQPRWWESDEKTGEITVTPDEVTITTDSAKHAHQIGEWIARSVLVKYCSDPEKLVSLRVLGTREN